MTPRTRRLIFLAAALVSVSSGAVAVAGSSWLTAPPPSEDPIAVDSSADVATAPTEVANGPLSQSVGQVVADLPEIKTLIAAGGVDFIENEVTVGIVRYRAADGAKIEFIVQQLPGPISAETVGPPEDTRVESGPGGEEVIIRQTAHIIQVVAIDSTGMAVNIIVELTVPESRDQLSTLSAFDSATVTGWALALLSGVGS
ncbi:MAG: hypothetical protein Q8Q52_06975 [Acidimicrobiia bacterium]|nr:hypothetical protein [Acidimicrobiia bacterium]